jgi:hypothetical protein
MRSERWPGRAVWFQSGFHDASWSSSLVDALFQGWLLAFTAASSAYLAREMHNPSPTRLGFYVGTVSSQMHLPILTCIGFSVWLATPLPSPLSVRAFFISFIISM